MLRTKVLDRPAYHLERNEILPRDVEKLLLFVLTSELELVRSLNLIRVQLENRYDFSTHGAFKAIDKIENDYLDDFAIAGFL